MKCGYCVESGCIYACAEVSLRLGDQSDQGQAWKPLLHTLKESRDSWNTHNSLT